MKKTRSRKSRDTVPLTLLLCSNKFMVFSEVPYCGSDLLLRVSQFALTKQKVRLIILSLFSSDICNANCLPRILTTVLIKDWKKLQKMVNITFKNRNTNTVYNLVHLLPYRYLSDNHIFLSPQKWPGRVRIWRIIIWLSGSAIKIYGSANPDP